MAFEERNLDGKDRIDEGAVLTLIDLSGTSVPWTLSRPSTRGATVALHARILDDVPDGPVVARANVRAHDDRVFWCDVAVHGREDRRVCALGQLTYRFS